MIKKSKIAETEEVFFGDNKTGKWLLVSLENRLVKATIHLIPKWIETYHLTLMTLVWSAVIVFAGYLARKNINWFWLFSAMIFMQYLTDLLDGKIGKLRNTGLVKWGYCIDHFFDYIFLCSILFAYSFFVPQEYYFWGLAAAMIIIGFMMNSYLFSATISRFKISYFGIGPTESRLFFVLVNTFLIIFGVKYLSLSLPYIAITVFVGLVIAVYQSHKKTWQADMKDKMW